MRHALLVNGLHAGQSGFGGVEDFWGNERDGGLHGWIVPALIGCATPRVCNCLARSEMKTAGNQTVREIHSKELTSANTGDSLKSPDVCPANLTVT
jgi:hypothetical protein